MLSGQADYTALVDPHVVVVTNFEGWSTSFCWWANVIGGYPNRETYADLSNVSRIVTHTYSANAPASLPNLAASLHKPLWASEFGHCDATGMTQARRIHDDIAQMGARAWLQ